MKLYNTLTRKVDDFTPLEDGKVKLYTCGLTVYSQPHIGNWVAYIYWDLLVRTLRASGYDIDRVQNITDVGHLTDDGDAGEDKMQKGALREGKTAWDVAAKYISIADHEAFEQLGLLRPEHMPRATDYIQQQIDFVKELEQKDFVYKINDGMYFDTSKFPDYGKMARLDIKGLEFGARVADTGKKTPTDFAVWKFSPADQKRDMEWDSPWGKGFPGWHLECSVMARELLGDTIDIHTGGIDHIPVHHTNEIAQTESVTGKKFANFWLHANHMKVDGTKMSKSLGNIYTLDDITKKGYSVMAFKMLVLSKHYRTEGNFTWDILEASANRLKRWQSIAVLRHQTNDTLENDDDKDTDHDINGQILAAPHASLEALQNDLSSPEAIAKLERLFDVIEKSSLAKLQQSALTELFSWIDDTLGLQLMIASPDISDDAKRLLLQRKNARESKDWAAADQLRQQLTTRGITVRDTAHDQIWEYSR